MSLTIVFEMADGQSQFYQRHESRAGITLNKERQTTHSDLNLLRNYRPTVITSTSHLKLCY